jgi:hypothetical protein
MAGRSKAYAIDTSLIDLDANRGVVKRARKKNLPTLVTQRAQSGAVGDGSRKSEHSMDAETMMRTLRSSSFR